MQTTEKPKPELLRLPQVLEILPIARATFYRGIKRGIYPEPVKLGRVSAWRATEIHAVANGDAA